MLTINNNLKPTYPITTNPLYYIPIITLLCLTPYQLKAHKKTTKNNKNILKQYTKPLALTLLGSTLLIIGYKLTKHNPQTQTQQNKTTSHTTPLTLEMTPLPPSPQSMPIPQTPNNQPSHPLALNLQHESQQTSISPHTERSPSCSTTTSEDTFRYNRPLQREDYTTPHFHERSQSLNSIENEQTPPQKDITLSPDIQQSDDDTTTTFSSFSSYDESATDSETSDESISESDNELTKEVTALGLSSSIEGIALQICNKKDLRRTREKASVTICYKNIQKLNQQINLDTSPISTNNIP